MFSPFFKVGAIAGCLGGLLIAGPASAAEVKTPGSKAATPIEIPGKGEPKMKQPPSRKATPIEIPGKGKPQIKQKPSVGVEPLPLPDQQQR